MTAHRRTASDVKLEINQAIDLTDNDDGSPGGATDETDDCIVLYCIFAIILSTFRLFKGQQYLCSIITHIRFPISYEFKHPSNFVCTYFNNIFHI